MKWVSTLLALAGVLLIAFAPKQDAPSVTSDSDVLTYVLADVDEVLYVSDSMSGPALGGLARTPSVTITEAELEAGCARYLERFEAVVADGEPACLRAHRGQAETFVRGRAYSLSSTGFTVFVRRKAS